jgi:hypothetical protein
MATDRVVDLSDVLVELDHIVRSATDRAPSLPHPDA